MVYSPTPVQDTLLENGSESVSKSNFKSYRKILLALPLVILLLLPPILFLVTHPSPRTISNTEPTCPYSVVYVKPHKTAGTKIQSDIVEWAKTSHWTAITCQSHEPNIQLHECVPDNRHGCVIVATHMIVDTNLERLLYRNLGDDLRWMASTRSGRERRLSHFLQFNRLKHDKVVMDDLKNWLRGTNPWSDYNYMTGELRTGSCPLAKRDKRSISYMVSKYDIVIDADLRNVSNIILKHFGLFQLTDSFANVRGAGKLDLDAEAEQLVKNATCVDGEMHRQFRVRMGSLYEMITGAPCNKNRREVVPCF